MREIASNVISTTAKRDEGRRESATQNCPSGRSTFRAALLAPWRFFNIERMVRDFSVASHGKVRIVFLLHALLLSVTFMTLVALSIQFETYGHVKGKVVFRYSSIMDVVNEWRVDPVRSPLFIIPAVCTVGLAFCAVFTAWLLLPNTFRGGSALQAWRAAFAAVLSCVGILNVLMAGLLAGYIAQNALFGQDRDLRELSAVLCVLGSFLAFACLIKHMEQATLLAGNMQAHEAHTLRCEGCGYDLTHQPQGGLCTECGLELRESTNLDARRRGIPWQRGRSLTNWAVSTLQLLFRPASAYRMAQVQRQPKDSVQFAFFHRAAIAAGACYWALCLALNYSGGSVFEHVVIPIHVAVVVSLVAWGLHRLVSAIVFTYALMRRTVRDGAASHHVIQFEAAYLWAFCLVNGALVTSFFVFDGTWMSTVITGRPLYFFQGLPIEIWIIGGLNVGLILLWCLRIWKGFHAVRWSNF